MGANPKEKYDILHELLGGRFVGGTLSQLANYSELFIKMSDAVFLVDRHSLRVLECNPASLSLLKCGETEILGVELPVLLGKEVSTQKTLTNKLSQFQNKPDFHFSTEMEYQNAHGDDFFFELDATPLKILDYIEVIQLIVKDVTEVRRARQNLQEMNEALKNLSTTDEMTGLRNYRYLKEVLTSVHHQALNFNQHYGIIFLDVDHFKKFNDRNGHPAGDEVLRRIASILKSVCRAQDLPCRYGGEEFVVLCRGTTHAETLAQAEKLRAAIATSDFPFGAFQPLGRVSASIGVATFPECAATFEEVLKHADEALYQSKELGRNLVTSFLNIIPSAKKTG